MRKRRFITQTDSYKLTHWLQYPPGTTKVHSYFESRLGAMFDFTCFYGLQMILKDSLVGQVVTREDIEWAANLSLQHFGSPRFFNREGWEYILKTYQGRLPLRIRAVPEGLCVPTNHLLMTVENTDDNCAWLTNGAESILTHVWYPSTVATLSRQVKLDLWQDLVKSCDNPEAAIPFMLHDFGYRGVTCDDAARRGGSAHLINFMGTDTLVAMEEAHDSYHAKLENLAFSVPATEHSVATAEGPDGEESIVARLLDEYPNGPLSMVSDSYDVYNFIDNIIGKKFKDKIRQRGPNNFGIRKVVTRPDSPTARHPETEDQMLWIAETHWKNFDRGHVNHKGYRVFEDCIGALWGDGINRPVINKVSQTAMDAGFSAENFIYGMGGGLLQKINRDTQRFAFKCSAQQRNGEWHDIYKEPLDKTKASKRGRLKLVRDDQGGFITLTGQDAIDDNRPDVLQTVFLNGELMVDHTFDEIKERAK